MHIPMSLSFAILQYQFGSNFLSSGQKVLSTWSPSWEHALKWSQELTEWILNMEADKNTDNKELTISQGSVGSHRIMLKLLFYYRIQQCISSQSQG